MRHASRLRWPARTTVLGGMLALLCAIPGTTLGAPGVSAYPSLVVADGAAAYWRLGERSGTVARDEVAGANGTYVGDPALGRPGALVGDADTSVRLDGTNDTMRVPTAPALSPVTALTLEAWIKPTAITAPGMTVLRKGLQYELSVSSRGRLVLGLWRGGTKITVSSSPGIIVPGPWSHVVGTWDGATAAVYLNGVRRASASVPAPIDTGSNNVFIGSSGGAGNAFAGSVDEAALYRRTLSADRVQAHFREAGDLSPPTPILRSPAGGSTMHSRPTFGGRAGDMPGDRATTTVRVYAGAGISGAPFRTFSARRHEGGSFSVIGPRLPSGTYTARVVQQDTSGNTGRSTPRRFTVKASGDPSLILAGDISACTSTGDDATAALLDRLPGIVGTLGDTVYDSGTPAEYRNCYDPTWGRHLARTRPSVGDHEYETRAASGYFGYFDVPHWYSYDLGTWHVVVLDTNCWVGSCGPGTARLRQTQEAWLRTDLAANNDRCTVVYGHHPRFSSGPHGSIQAMRRPWEIFRQYGVDVYAAGNDHIYERFQVIDGVRQFVVGTGGSWLYAIKSVAPGSLVRSTRDFGVLRLILHRARYTWTFLPVGGGGFTDAGSTSCSKRTTPGADE